MLKTNEFRDYLISAWSKSLIHSYPVPDRAKDKGNAHGGSVFQVDSLSDCLEHYSWLGDDYPTTVSKLNELQLLLSKALEAEDDISVKHASFEIYNWGGVKYRKNISGYWIEKTCDAGLLTTKIKDCVHILTSGNHLDRFDGIDLIMNSGFTKVISLASASLASSLVIYDGRVGAALGDLAILAADELGYSSLDDELKFPWGASRSTSSTNPRNPSRNGIILPRLFGANSHFKHAVSMYRASKLVSEVAANLGVAPRDLEAALFMWGYDVRSRWN